MQLFQTGSSIDQFQTFSGYSPLTSLFGFPAKVLFLNELEEVLELTGAEQLEKVHGPLFRVIAKVRTEQNEQTRWRR